MIAKHYVLLSLFVKKHKIIKQKHLCKLTKKEVADSLAEIVKAVKNSKFVCTKCARASSIDALLCHPNMIK